MKDNNFLELVLDTTPQRIKVKHEEVFSTTNNKKNAQGKTKSRNKKSKQNKKNNGKY